MKHHDAPATKADIAALMDSIGKLFDANERWKEEIKRHFDVSVEKIEHDLKGALGDAISLCRDCQNRHERRSRPAADRGIQTVDSSRMCRDIRASAGWVCCVELIPFPPLL